MFNSSNANETTSSQSSPASATSMRSYGSPPSPLVPSIQTYHPAPLAMNQTAFYQQPYHQGYNAPDHSGGVNHNQFTPQANYQAYAPQNSMHPGQFSLMVVDHTLNMPPGFPQQTPSGQTQVYQHAPPQQHYSVNGYHLQVPQDFPPSQNP